MHLQSPPRKAPRYIITKHSIETNPDNIFSITKMGQVKNNVKDVQWLMGCLAALSHFVSWLGERGLPLYKL
jgi:hypothetical protein